MAEAETKTEAKVEAKAEAKVEAKAEAQVEAKTDNLAALDLGSNTFRLILASPGAGGLAQSQVWQELPRLSEGLGQGARLAEGPKKRALEVLEGFDAIIKSRGAAKVLAGGTMVFRRASDGPEFLREVGERFGWATRVLSGAEEAHLSARGVLSGLDPLPPESLIFDIGGRSTEFISTRGKDIVAVQSLNMGVVGLTEDFIKSDPPQANEMLALESYIRDLLAGGDWTALTSAATLVGTAGTVTTLAAMLLKMINNDPKLINNRVIDIESILNLLMRLAQETNSQRQARPGLHPRRADVIVSGLILVSVIMDYFSKAKIIISDYSLLEGWWLAAAGLASFS
jgi:exopolyphosphatase/guanosine-5'-triphosphate,3'-diphosphate pyrophosphatase